MKAASHLLVHAANAHGAAKKKGPDLDSMDARESGSHFGGIAAAAVITM
jgi:hypothetical protein